MLALVTDFAPVSFVKVPRSVCTACHCNLELHYCSITEINYAENSHYIHHDHRDVMCHTDD